MELQALEIQVCAKTEAKSLEMAFLAKIASTMFSAVSQLFEDKITLEVLFGFL